MVSLIVIVRWPIYHLNFVDISKLYLFLRLSPGLEEVRKLLLLCEQRTPDLAPGQSALQNYGGRPGKDYQRTGKWVCSGPREGQSISKQTSVDRSDVYCWRLLLEWLLSSSLQGVGSKWTQWKIPGTLRHHVDWAYNPFAEQSKRLLEWQDLWGALFIPCWPGVQKTLLTQRKTNMQRLLKNKFGDGPLLDDIKMSCKV